ncbi:MAG TPA: PDZ domain-containing protein [Bacteroidales bacterium]
MKILKTSFLLILSLIAFFQRSTAQTRLLRFPTVSEKSIAFSYGGDIYTVDINGGNARKLTNHVGYECFPRFSPDGKWIAFTGQYDGNTEVYLIPSEGGTPKRLTYTATLQRDDIGDRMGPNNIVICWTPDGKNIVYRSRQHSFNDFKGKLYKVSIDGGLSEELPFSVGGFCSYSPDGNQLAYNRVFREFRTWKRYRGGMADDIRIFNFKTKETINITNNDAQDIIPMWIDKDIYYTSDRTGRLNLYKYNTSTKNTEQKTLFTDFDVKFPSSNGSLIVYENAGYIYKYDTKTGQNEKVDITVSDDKLWARDEIKNTSTYIRSFDLSKNGERVVFSARGDIYSLPATKGITYNLTRTPGVHERNVTWSPDGKYIAYLSDATGEFEIYIQPVDGSSQAVQLTKNADTYYYEMVWSPDSKKILWADRKFRLRYIDVATKAITEITQSKYGSVGDYKWSPDSRWVVFAQEADNHFSIITVYDTKNKSLHDITSKWFFSHEPSFSPDGKYIAISSARDFTPSYSDIEWNYAYFNMEKLYLILLKKDGKSPFAPENIEVTTDTSNTDKKKPAETKEKKSETAVEIDFENIEQRLIPVPVKASSYYNVWMAGDGIYYNERSEGKTNTFKYYDLKKKEETELGTANRYAISSNGKKMLVNESGKWGVIDLPTSKISLKDEIDCSNMMANVNYKKEWRQIFDEAWRQMRDFFYVENMHGLDWKAVHDKYAPLVDFVGHRDDLTYIIGEMIGELSIGHAYINSGEKPKAPRINTGLLGAKLIKDNSGYFKVTKILQGANWNKDLRSPLTEPGVKIAEGNYILAIDGVDIKQCADIYEMLYNKADKTIALTVNSKPEITGSWQTLVIPVADESNLYYYEWVQKNLKLVESATNGEVGYIHIPDMVSEGLNEFVKHFYPQLQKKVVIIDDRGNGGGNVSPQILERLQRVPYRMKMHRNATVPGTVPNETMTGAKIMLIDQYSASDGDLFPYGFKKLKLGKVIGVRTWGGVVGISGSLPFIDGTDLRKPEFASYSSDSSQWIIEGHGVEPDIVVENDPAREYEGIDDQLNKAIELAKQLAKEQKPLPAIPTAPDKSK